jgi:hypothetical protein
MAEMTKTSRILGIAFLLQFVTSFFNGAVLIPQFVNADDIQKTVALISANPNLFRLSILLDMTTALGIVFLGVALYSAVKDSGRKMALTGLMFYVLEACLLAVSKIDSFQLLQFSLANVGKNLSAAQTAIASALLGRIDFAGGTLHMLVFCLGALLFYILLYKGKKVPRGLSLWGIITIPFLFLWTVLSFFGVMVPFFLYLPYVPFELVMGIWIAFRGTALPIETPKDSE